MLPSALCTAWVSASMPLAQVLISVTLCSRCAVIWTCTKPLWVGWTVWPERVVVASDTVARSLRVDEAGFHHPQAVLAAGGW